MAEILNFDILMQETFDLPHP